MKVPEHVTVKLFRNVALTDRGCWQWRKRIKFHGYPYIKINGKNFRCNRLVWMIFKGEIPNGLFVLHRCDNKRCLNPDHLFLGTNDENMKDAALKNRFPHKLEISEVAEVRRLSQEGFSQTEISKRLGITQGHVSKIVNRKRRTHLQ